MRGKRKYKIYKINKGKFAAFVLTVYIAVFVVNVVVSLAKYPEEYITPWRYQMESDLAEGNEEALEYYNKTYVANGKQLFGDKYIVER